MNIKIASVDCVIIYFEEIISKEISQKVKSAYKILKDLDNSAFIEIIPSYNSIFIKYDIFKYDFNGIKLFLKSSLALIKEFENNNSSIINIDVYYDKEVGLDLEIVAKNANLSIEEVIKIHSSTIYDVYAIGFLPGFAYLASIDERIITPRLKTPRKKIPKGCVAIADNQTAVYPKDSPGGWNILGKTTFEFFDKNLDTLSPILIDSKIKFNPISKEEFLSQGGVI